MEEDRKSALRWLAFCAALGAGGFFAGRLSAPTASWEIVLNDARPWAVALCVLTIVASVTSVRYKAMPSSEENVRSMYLWATVTRTGISILVFYLALGFGFS